MNVATAIKAGLRLDRKDAIVLVGERPPWRSARVSVYGKSNERFHFAIPCKPVVVER